MRLLHTSNLELVSFIGKSVEDRPRYAILSHTWKDDEFLFDEAQNGIHQHFQSPRRGLRKILNACEKAKQDNLDYIWVDTCCIDKSSSAELSEAINSMFKWYKESASCYVFMDDVTLQENGVMGNFDESRWFTRGWTLQELVAPHGLIFFDRHWKYMCTRDQIASRLEKITGVTPSILQRSHTLSPPKIRQLFGDERPRCPGCGHYDEVKTDLAEEPISRKMAWAAKRSTTRPEDTSYCLLGLFDINMPLLYGEGENAFWRLQEEILKKSPDQSILTWTMHPTGELRTSHLPKMPSAFRFAFQQPEGTLIERGDIIATTRGLEIDVLFGTCDVTEDPFLRPRRKRQQYMAILSCAAAQDPLLRVAILVQPLTPGALDTAYTRVRDNSLIQLHPRAEPLVLDTSMKGELYESKEAAVAYDPQKLSPRRILLAAVRPTGDLPRQRPEVYIAAPEIKNLKINIKERTTIYNTKIAYQQPPGYRATKVGFLNICGVWHLENGNSGFFLLWGVPTASADGDFVTWVETSRSFLQGENLLRSTVEEALRPYMDSRNSTVVFLPKDILEPDLKVKVTVERAEFLGRKAYTIVLDIDGWDDHSVSMVKYLQVWRRGWI